MSEEKQFCVVRSEGRAYFGEILREDEGFLLGGAVELFTAMMQVPGGMRKQVTVIGLDYNSGPLQRLLIERVGVVYRRGDMNEKDWAALKADYDKFCEQDNLVKTPDPKQLVLPQ